MVDCVKKNPLLQILLLSMLSGKAAHASSFVVEDIQVKGLQRISAGTVYNYLPVNVGETFSEDKQAAAIRALFNTGFFKDISLERDGGTLVVNVVERPSVAKVVIEGNKDIKKEDLTEALKKNRLGGRQGLQQANPGQGRTRATPTIFQPW